MAEHVPKAGPRATCATRAGPPVYSGAGQHRRRAASRWRPRPFRSPTTSRRTTCTACRSRATPRASGTGRSPPACTTTRGPAARADNRAAAGRRRRGRHAAGPGRHTGWNTLAAKGTWRPARHRRRAHRRLRRRPRRLQAPHPKDQRSRQLARRSAGRARQRCRRRQRNPAAPGRRTPGPSRRSGRRCWACATKTGGPATASRTVASTRSRTRPRSESDVSPKAALAYQLADDTVLKASVGRAVRFPTVGELYGATSGGALSVHQRPEPQAREVVDRRTVRREGPGQRPGARHAVPRDHATTRSTASSIPGSTTVSRVQNVDKCAPPASSWPTPGKRRAACAGSTWAAA